MSVPNVDEQCEDLVQTLSWPQHSSVVLRFLYSTSRSYIFQPAFSHLPDVYPWICSSCHPAFGCQHWNLMWTAKDYAPPPPPPSPLRVVKFALSLSQATLKFLGPFRIINHLHQTLFFRPVVLYKGNCLGSYGAPLLSLWKSLRSTVTSRQHVTFAPKDLPFSAVYFPTQFGLWVFLCVWILVSASSGAICYGISLQLPEVAMKALYLN